MSGKVFQYTPGIIEATFSQGDFDYIKLDMCMRDASVIETPCDDQFQIIGQPDDPIESSKNFSVIMSSVFCPFNSLIRFLEAITTQVQECGFYWEAEGPDGEMRWFSRFDENGRLEVSWMSGEDSFNHIMPLSSRQAVNAIYTALREFALSEHYNPLQYEELSIGETVQLLNRHGDLDSLNQILVGLNSIGANWVLIQLLSSASDTALGKSPLIDIDSWIEESKSLEWASLDGYFPYIPSDWDFWSLNRRNEELSVIYEYTDSFGHGVNLRTLRSPLVETWLSEHDS